MNRKYVLYLLVLLLFSSQTLWAQLETCNLVITDGIQNEQLKQTMEKNVSEFLTSCNSAVMKGVKPELNKKTSTDDARKRFSGFWDNSPIGCSVSTLERKCLTRASGGYQIRDIPVTMFAAPENEQNQEIVINLTLDGKIDDIFVPITQYTDILNAGEKTEDLGLREMVLDFVENFRTAYNRKDINFISDMFSNNAIIITGKEIKQKPNTDSPLRGMMSNAQFEYQVRTKQQYIASLRNTFNANRFINVEFTEEEVEQHKDYPKVYGVTLKQKWDSSLYSDVGYVFLLIDFRDESHPLIHVRTWQPEKYGDNQTLARDQVYQMYDVNMKQILGNNK